MHFHRSCDLPAPNNASTVNWQATNLSTMSYLSAFISVLNDEIFGILELNVDPLMNSSSKWTHSA